MIPCTIKRQKSSFIDALNIFSKNKRPYKPSIITSATRGPVVEQFKHIANKVPPKNDIDIGRLVNIVDMAAASKETLEYNEKLMKVSDSEFRNMMKAVNEESQLVRICEFLYFHERLTYNRLTAIILNRNLVTMKRLPFDVDHLSLGWSEIDKVKFDILLMRKYASSHKPLSIIKKLNDHYECRFLPMIVNKKLPQYYERLVWKYYFDYVSQNEREMILKLNDIKHSMTIWESSLKRNHTVAGYILEIHQDMNEILALFFKIYNDPKVQEAIQHDLQSNKYSQVLSNLKKISINHQLYKVGDLNNTTTEQRAEYYMALDALERFANAYNSSLTSQITDIRLKITKFNKEDIGHWNDKLVLLSSFMK